MLPPALVLVSSVFSSLSNQRSSYFLHHPSSCGDAPSVNISLSLHIVSSNPSPKSSLDSPSISPSITLSFISFRGEGWHLIFWLPAHFYDGSSSNRKLISCLFLLQLQQAGITHSECWCYCFMLFFCSLDISGMHINRKFSIFAGRTPASL